jgi:hypothetical protein
VSRIPLHPLFRFLALEGPARLLMGSASEEGMEGVEFALILFLAHCLFGPSRP